MLRDFFLWLDALGAWQGVVVLLAIQIPATFLLITGLYWLEQWLVRPRPNYRARRYSADAQLKRQREGRTV